MPEVKVVVETGRLPGSRSSRRLRHEGKIPGVVYGHGLEPLSVAVDAKELRSALSGEAGLNTLLDLQVDGTSHLTLARAIQRHPVRGTVTHVDFQVVRRDEIVTSEIPVNLVGEAVEVHRGDGMVDQQLFSLMVKAVPARIPNSVEVDVSELTIGQSIRAGEIRLPEGVETDVDPDSVVVVGQPPQVKAADLVAEGEEAAEAAAAEGAPAEEVAAAEAGAGPAGGEGGEGGEG